MSLYTNFDLNREVLERHGKYLWDAQIALIKAQEAAKGSPSEVDKWLRGSRHKTVEEAINIYEQVVIKQQEALRTAQRRNDSHFKKYIVARVDIDQPLQEFLVAQEQYSKALEVFSPLIQKYGEVLGLTKESTLRFVNLSLPQIRDSDGRTTVV